MGKKPAKTPTKQGSATTTKSLEQIVAELAQTVREEEAKYNRGDHPTDSLWDHLKRVGKLAKRLAREEGLDETACYVAGVFHDAGKFFCGQYHNEERAEEERSVDTLRKLTEGSDVDPQLIEDVAAGILQLYRGDPDPSPLAQVLFDADNLEKLGPLGIANYFIKTGLRGKGVSENLLFRITVELTYARYAVDSVFTDAAKKIAAKRAPQTIHFLREFLDTIREDGLYNFTVEEVPFGDLILDVVAPEACQCKGALRRKIWEVPGLKCIEIHLEHTCEACGKSHKIRFCNPRLH